MLPVDVLDPAPSICSELDVANNEVPFLVRLPPKFRLHEMSEEPMIRLDSAKDDVVLLDLVNRGDGVVSGPVIGARPRKQRPP